MKILLLTGSLKQGGAEFQLIALAKLLNGRGHTVRVLALTDHQFYRSLLDEASIDYQYLANDISKVRRVLQVVEAVNRFSPDLVISYLRSVSIVGMLAKLFSKRKTKLITSERTSLTIRYYDDFYFFISRYVDALTVNSTFKLRYIKSNFPALARKVYFVPNIMDLTRFEKIERVERKDDDHFRLVYVGRISPEKNIDKLLAAIKSLRDGGHLLGLNLYGETRHQAYFSLLKNQIEEGEMTSYVTLNGPTSNVIDVYRTADAVCLISAYEGFSNVLSEALACGCPIIASDIEENRYLVTNGENGFLVQAKPADIANGILRLMSLPQEEQKIIARNNIKKASEIFDQDNIYQQYKEIIENINS